MDHKPLAWLTLDADDADPQVLAAGLALAAESFGGEDAVLGRQAGELAWLGDKRASVAFGEKAGALRDGGDVVAGQPALDPDRVGRGNLEHDIALAHRLALGHANIGDDPALVMLDRLAAARYRDHAVGIGAGIERRQRGEPEQADEESGTDHRPLANVATRRVGRFVSVELDAPRRHPSHVIHDQALSWIGTTWGRAALRRIDITSSAGP